MRKIIGNIIYKRDIYCGFVGYTDESWVWIVRSKKEKVLNKITYYLKVRKIIPKKHLILIGKVRLGGNLLPEDSLVNITTLSKFNSYPKLTKEDLDLLEMYMEEPHFKNAICFRPYTLEI